MAVTYRENPQNPIDFFAKWLLNHSQVKKFEAGSKERLEQLQELKDKHELQIKQQAKETAKAD